MTATQPNRFAQLNDGKSDLASAMTALRSSGHSEFVKAMGRVLTDMQLKPHRLIPVLSDDQQATRLSVAAAIGKPVSEPSALYAAAWHGLLGRQPSVLAFRTHPQGDDSLYHLQLHGSGDKIKQAMDDAGVPSRIMVPHGDSFRVLIHDKKRQLRPNVAKLASAFGVQVGEARGFGHEIGGDTPEAARAAYRKIIDKTEGNAPAAQRFVRAVREVFRFATEKDLSGIPDTGLDIKSVKADNTSGVETKPPEGRKMTPELPAAPPAQGKVDASASKAIPAASLAAIAKYRSYLVGYPVGDRDAYIDSLKAGRPQDKAALKAAVKQSGISPRDYVIAAFQANEQHSRTGGGAKLILATEDEARKVAELLGEQQHGKEVYGKAPRLVAEKRRPIADTIDSNSPSPA